MEGHHEDLDDLLREYEPDGYEDDYNDPYDEIFHKFKYQGNFLLKITINLKKTSRKT